MIQKPKSVQIYQSEILSAFAAAGIRQLSPGGKARAFSDIVGDKIGESEARGFAAVGQSLLPYAVGQSLDFLGEMYGVPRLHRSDVVSSALSDNFNFYVVRGNFGQINSGRPIVIPAGTRISTADVGPVSVTAAEITLDASASTQSFPAIALNPGEAGNAPAGVFTKHNFTAYSDARYGSLLVTNNYGLVEGREEEDDDSYRYRISLKLQSRGGAAEADIRLAVLAVPGVQDVVFTREAGSFTAYVYGISPVVSPSLLALVQAEVDQRTAYPLVGTCVAPDLVGVSLSTVAQFAANTSPADRSSSISSAVRAAEDYINNLAVGETLIVNEIADRLRDADSKIIDIGSPNKPLSDIFLWRSRVDGSRYSRYLVGNYEPAIGERLVVESISNAITVTAS